MINRCCAYKFDGGRCKRRFSLACSEGHCWQHCKCNKHGKVRKHLGTFIKGTITTANILKAIEYIIEKFSDYLGTSEIEELELIIQNEIGRAQLISRFIAISNSLPLGIRDAIYKDDGAPILLKTQLRTTRHTFKRRRRIGWTKTNDI